jgi:hypothetical protein
VSYTELSVEGYPIISSKIHVVPEVMTIFRETDKRIFQRLFSQRNQLVWGEILPEEDHSENAVTYECAVLNICDRLDIMGFTINRCKSDFEKIRLEKLDDYKSMQKNNDESALEILGFSAFKEELEILEVLTFEKYVEVLQEVIKNKELVYSVQYEEIKKLDPIRQHIFSEDDCELGFFANDCRSLIRVVCSLVPNSAFVVQDVTEVVHAGYYSESDSICEFALKLLTDNYPENAPRIILAEGSSDIAIIKQGMGLLYPHLIDYYTFLDFSGSRAQGGAGNLANTIKSFASVGISNRIIAIFDNDASAADACRSLSLISLPSNIAVCKYPDISFLSNYPTLGPSGQTNLDVNGLAASVELYLGADVLVGNNKEFYPVQWKGFVEGVGKYQGEVMNKSEIQSNFVNKVKKCKESPELINSSDWNNLKEVLKVIFNAFDKS